MSKYGIHAYNSKKYGPIIQGFEITSSDKEVGNRKFLSESESERFTNEAKHAKYSWYDKKTNTGHYILCPIDHAYKYWLEQINK